MAELENKVEVNIVGQGEGDANGHNDSQDGEHDPHFEPIITLPEVQISTMEEEEVELIKLRAKLYRYDNTSNPAEWKERGTGEVKLLHHETKNTVRVVMRRDKTLKICANHYVTPFMELKPSYGSDRAWVWSVMADYADEVAQRQLLAIRFANSKNAKQWKETFDEAKHIVETKCDLYVKSMSEHFESLKIGDEKSAEEENDDDNDSDVEQNNENATKPDDGKGIAAVGCTVNSEKPDQPATMQSAITETQLADDKSSDDTNVDSPRK